MQLSSAASLELHLQIRHCDVYRGLCAKLLLPSVSRLPVVPFTPASAVSVSSSSIDMLYSMTDFIPANQPSLAPALSFPHPAIQPPLQPAAPSYRSQTEEIQKVALEEFQKSQVVASEDTWHWDEKRGIWSCGPSPGASSPAKSAEKKKPAVPFATPAEEPPYEKRNRKTEHPVTLSPQICPRGVSEVKKKRILITGLDVLFALH